MGTYREYTETVYSQHNWQGFGADLVMLARLRASQLLNQKGLGEAKLCGTIHDSIVCEAPSKNVKEVGQILNQAVSEVPDFCKRIWNYDFSLPLKSEVTYGPNKTDMVELEL